MHMPATRERWTAEAVRALPDDGNRYELIDGVLLVTPAPGRAPADWPDMRELLLACEVLSPSTARYDRVVKRRFFSRTRVHEYWVVDLDAEVIERSRRGEEHVDVIAEQLVWQPTEANMALTIDLPTFFRGIARRRALD